MDERSDGVGGPGYEDVDPAVSQSAYEDLAGPEADDVAELVNNYSVMDEPATAFAGGPADAVLSGESEGTRAVGGEGVEVGLGGYEGDPSGDDGPAYAFEYDEGGVLIGEPEDYFGVADEDLHDGVSEESEQALVSALESIVGDDGRPVAYELHGFSNSELDTMGTDDVSAAMVREHADFWDVGAAEDAHLLSEEGGLPDGEVDRVSALLAGLEGGDRRPQDAEIDYAGMGVGFEDGSTVQTKDDFDLYLDWYVFGEEDDDE